MTVRPLTVPPSSALSSVFWAGAVVLAGFAVYWPALDAGFVGDDFMILHRLRGLSAPPDALRFFRGEFFEYYRPLAFLSHALDWMVAGSDPRQFHLTNLVLHAANSVLVLLIARALAPRSVAAPVAALLFALHASNHEAVVWISARFDLLATLWSLLAIWWMVAGAPGVRWVPALLFFLAVLSKESAVALPLGTAAWAAFCLRASTRDTVARVAPWLVALVAYAVLRQAAGGVPAAGGAGRLPKLMMFGAALLFLIGCADERWLRLREHLRAGGRWPGALLASAAIAFAGVGALQGGIIAEKLAVAGFALVYLVLPVTDVGAGGAYLEPVEAIYRRAAIIGLPAVALAIWALRRHVLADPRFWFLAALFVATLIPISALTEGRRYLYLPSTVLSLAIGVGIAELRRRWQVLALGAVTVLLTVSSWQISTQVPNWVWAGQMTSEGARLVDATLAPACNAGHVVFLTSPVGVRGVYTHFYYETFEPVRGCIPETFQIVARVLRADAQVDAQWASADRITLTVPDYRGNLVVSDDLRHFDRLLRDVRTGIVQTPLGELRAEAYGATQLLTLTLAPHLRPETIHFFYFSAGRLHRLPHPTAPNSSLQTF